MKIERLISAKGEDNNLRVLVEPDRIEPDRFGVVAMVPPNKYIQPGEHITYGQYGGTDLAIPGDKIYKIMRLSDVYAVVE